ncbi:hypothetical protein HK405_002543, partial [Cladochytrium tenue]
PADAATAEPAAGLAQQQPSPAWPEAPAAAWAARLRDGAGDGRGVFDVVRYAVMALWISASDPAAGLSARSLANLSLADNRVTQTG